MLVLKPHSHDNILTAFVQLFTKFAFQRSETFVGDERVAPRLVRCPLSADPEILGQVVQTAS